MSICCVYFYIKFIMKGPGVFGPGRGNIMKKRSGVLRTILKTLPAFLALACLAGCSREEREHYKEVEKNAAAYYKNKYGEDVTVVDSKVAGNSGLFGYHGVVDRAYEMSDGTQVYWNDEEEYFADNRQAEEIAAALRSEVIEPALAEMDPDHTVTEYSFNRTGFDSFDESVFREYFDGDLEDFAGREKIAVRNLDAVVHEFCYRAKVEQFFASVGKYLSQNRATIAVLRDDPAVDEPFVAGSDWPEGDLRVKGVAYLDFGEGLSWLDNEYVEVLDGVMMMIKQRDFVLEPGDITFVEEGTAADLQKKIDEAYYALPVDAEENKDGGYTVRDQRNESRAVLLDPEAPIYRVQFSDRLREQIDKNEDNKSFYIWLEDPENVELWCYYSGDDRYRFRIWMMWDDNRVRGSYESFSEGDLFYTGGVAYEKLEDEEPAAGTTGEAATAGTTGEATTAK